MSLADHTVTARLPLPDLVVVGVATTLSCPLYDSGALVAAVSGTCTVYDRDYNVVSTGAVTVTASIATYTVAAITTQDLDPEDGWQVVWSITTASATHTPRNDAALVRTRLYPVIGDSDLIRRVPALDPAGNEPITRATTYQDQIDEAWTEIELRLIADGRRPWLVLSPSRLRASHMYLALALVFEDLASRLNMAYEARAQDYRNQYESAWGSLTLKYDMDDDGDDDEDVRPAAMSTVFLSGR